MSLAKVNRGQTVVVQSGYSARCFALAAPDEAVAAAFTAFSRDGREARLYAVKPGETFVALTDTSDDGFVYVRRAVDGRHFACLLLPATYRAG